MRTKILCMLLVLPVFAWADDAPAPVGQARSVAASLLSQLGAALKAELAAGSPESAIGVCKQIAPDLAGRLSRENDLRVARVSLKARNPLLGAPDAWEQQALMAFDRAAANGDKAETLEQSAIVDEPQGRFLRYIKAIPVQPLCLACHGAPETIPPAVRDRLAAEYPHDRAVGYRVGEIRGAVTVKQRLAQEPR